MQGRRRISRDRFGNSYQLTKCKPNKNGFPVGFVELGGKLYRLEPSSASDGGMWVKVTLLPKTQNSNM